jgi:hypothetical protein
VLGLHEEISQVSAPVYMDSICLLLHVIGTR